MNEIVPTFESVYSQEYWEPIPPMHRFRYNNLYLQVAEVRKAHMTLDNIATKDMERQITDNMAVGLRMLLQGEEVEHIQEGELLGSSDDTKYVVPGNVLLVDSEEIALSRTPFEDESPYHTISHEFELAASGLSLFLRMRNNVNPRTETHTHEEQSEHQPSILNKMAEYLGLIGGDTEELDELYGSMHFGYSKQHVDPRFGRYRRKVNLYGVGVNPKGKTISLEMRHALVHDDEIEVVAPARRHAASFFGQLGVPLDARVGETINFSISKGNNTVLERIRSAYLCHRGAVERAPAKVKHSKLLPSRAKPLVN